MLFDYMFLTEHRHEFERWQGPIKTQPMVGDPNETLWCWTCGSWTNRAGVSFGQAWSVEPYTLARHYATLIKRGHITQREAIDFYRHRVSNFGAAVTDIDIAIGDINEGI